jgi:hypothetical protein
MNTLINKHPVWAGTAEISPHPGNDLLGTATGAYVAVVGLASSQDEFLSGVDRAMDALGFRVVAISEVQPVKAFDTADFDEMLRDRLDLLSEENPVEIGRFHAFSE